MGASCATEVRTPGVGDGVGALRRIVVRSGGAVDGWAVAVGPAVESEDPDAGVVAALTGFEGFGLGDRRERCGYSEDAKRRSQRGYGKFHFGVLLNELKFVDAFGFFARQEELLYIFLEHINKPYKLRRTFVILPVCK